MNSFSHSKLSKCSEGKSPKKSVQTPAKMGKINFFQNS